MKTTAFIAQPENLAGAAPHRNSSQRDRKAVEAFDTMLERQKTETDQKGKSGATETPAQQHVPQKDARKPDERTKIVPRFLPADGGFPHRLKDTGLPERSDQSADVPKDAPSVEAAAAEDTAEPIAAEASQTGTPGADISALTAQLLGLPNPDRPVIPDRQKGAVPVVSQSGVKNDKAEMGKNSAVSEVAGAAAELLGMPTVGDGDTPDFRHELKPVPQSHSRDAAHIAEMPADMDDATAAAIARTPVVVREQQTHFLHSPNGRPGFALRNQSLDPTHASEDHPKEVEPPALRAAQPRRAALRNEIVQVGLQGKSKAGELPGKSSDPPPPPATQVLNKILDAGSQNSAPPGTPISSTAWHPSERPFGALLRVIRLEMAPASLGVVHITLKGADAGLSISIEAERSQTAASLGADRAVLSSRLHEAGYSIDDLVVTTLDRVPDIAATPRSDQPTGTSSNQIATGTDDSSRRQTHDGSRRPPPQSQPDPHSQSEAHGTLSDGSIAAADTPRIPVTAWRGRHAMRSV